MPFHPLVTGKARCVRRSWTTLRVCSSALSFLMQPPPSGARVPRATGDDDVSEEFENHFEAIPHIAHVFASGRIELDMLYAQGTVAAFLGKSSGTRPGELAVFSGKEDESVRIFTGTLRDDYFARAPGVDWGTHQVLSIEPVEFLILRHPSRCTLNDSPDDEINIIPRTLVTDARFRTQDSSNTYLLLARLHPTLDRFVCSKSVTIAL